MISSLFLNTHQKIYNKISLSAHMYCLIITAQLCVIGLLMLKGILFYLENSEPIFWRRMIWFLSQKNDHSGIQDRHGLVQEYHVYSAPIGCMNYVADHSSWWCLLSLCWSGWEKCMASRSFFSLLIHKGSWWAQGEYWVLSPYCYSIGLHMFGCVIC